MTSGTSALRVKSERTDGGRTGHPAESARDHLYSKIGFTVRQMDIIIASLIVLLAAAFIAGLFL
ncbi:hypothetical protein [Caproiciproducens sp. CPB-2]|nr:hypothetical protein [Caproiciproducens sp. CPB-2]